MALAERQPPAGSVLIEPRTPVREVVARYPGIETVFDTFGLSAGGAGNGLESVGLFARNHGVDPPGLLRELNDFAAKRTGAVALPLAAEVPRRRPPDLYLIGVVTALSLALLAGFPLGILAAIGAVHDIGVQSRWGSLVQAHGHLQLIGWLGIFIAGMAYHVLPRFKQTPLRLEGLAVPSLVLLAAGVSLRTVSQPWAGSSPFAVLLVISAIWELLGTAAFAAVVTATLWPAARKTYDWYLLAACGWAVAAAAANLEVASGIAGDSFPVVPGAQDAALLYMELFGFAGLFILGISLRVLPHFLSLRPPQMRAMMPALVLYNAGLLLMVGSGWGAAYGDWARPDWMPLAAALLMGGAVLLYVLGLKVYLPALRSRDSNPERAHEKLIRASYVWLAVAFGIEVWVALCPFAGWGPPDFLQAGAARHALALGFATQMVFGVGTRALPSFADKQLYSRGLANVVFLLINLAAFTRVGSALLPWGSVTSRYDHIGMSGAFALLALAAFAYNTIRTVRRRRP